MGPKITGLLQRREERGSKLWSSGTYLNSLNSQIFKNHPKKLSKFFAAQIIKSILFDLKKSRFNADLKPPMKSDFPFCCEIKLGTVHKLCWQARGREQPNVNDSKVHFFKEGS